MVMDKDERENVIEKIRQLSSNARPKGVNKLVGHNRYRFRFSNYRVIYNVSDETLSIYIIKVGVRRKD